jgi:hypothetical protein
MSESCVCGHEREDHSRTGECQQESLFREGQCSCAAYEPEEDDDEDGAAND